jgi:hypothetical protein
MLKFVMFVIFIVKRVPKRMVSIPQILKRRGKDGQHPSNTEYMRSYRYKNKEKIRENDREFQQAYYQRNRPALKEKQRKYQKNNRHIANKNGSKYRASKRQAVPAWLTEEDHRNIGAVYAMAQRLCMCLGVIHHVDHIVPLQGKSVCGLHVPWNLAAIPGSLNVRKNNKLPQELQSV